MKVRFLKDHLQYKEGEETEVNDDMAAYWERVGVAGPATEKKKVEHTQEKNSKAGPGKEKIMQRIHPNIVVTEAADTTEPVDLEEVKRWLNVDFNDNDLLLMRMIHGARKTVENTCNMSFVEKTVSIDVETTCAEVIPLPYATAVKDVVVKELDDNDAETDLVVSTDYFVRRNGLRITKAGRFTVTYTTVPGDAPQDVKEAIMMEVAERYANRGENAGVLSQSALSKLQPHIVQWL